MGADPSHHARRPGLRRGLKRPRHAIAAATDPQVQRPSAPGAGSPIPKKDVVAADHPILQHFRPPVTASRAGTEAKRTSEPRRGQTAGTPDVPSNLRLARRALARDDRRQPVSRNEVTRSSPPPPRRSPQLVPSISADENRRRARNHCQSRRRQWRCGGPSSLRSQHNRASSRRRRARRI